MGWGAGLTTQEILSASVLGTMAAFLILPGPLFPLRRTPTFLVLFALCLVALPRVVSAQELPAAPTGPTLERAAVRLRYGLALRQGEQVDPGPGLTYSGATPNDLAVWATVYGLGQEWLGAQLHVQREGFSLNNESTEVTAGSLLRFSVAAVGRRRLGPVLGELSLGYGFAQLPMFSDSSSPSLAFQRGGRHAALLGGRVRIPLFQRAQAEVRAELPLALSAQDAAGGGASASGFAAGAAFLFPVKRVGRWEAAAVLDYQFVKDGLTADSGARSDQTLQRVGAALQLSWFDADGAPGAKDPPGPDARPGALTLQVLDAEKGTPLASAQVVLVVEGAAQAPRETNEKGQVRVPELPPGTVVAQVTAPGYEYAEGSATIQSEEQARLEVRARKLPPAVGSVKLLVTDKRDNTPIPDAKVVVGDKELRTDGAGQVRLEKLPAGPVLVKIAAEGFQSVEEAVVIVGGQETELPVPLMLAKRLGYATISGTVRSTRGAPLVATLAIPAANVRTRTGTEGAFSLKLKPGTFRIIISAKGHLTQTKTVTVRDGEQAIFNVDLFPRNR
jgi:hypothetical protein